MDSPDATDPNFDETAAAPASAHAVPIVSTDHSRSGGSSKRLMNRQRWLIALCVALLAPPSPAQEAADPALETYFAGNAAYNRKLFPIAAVKYEEFISYRGSLRFLSISAIRVTNSNITSGFS